MGFLWRKNKTAKSKPVHLIFSKKNYFKTWNIILLNFFKAANAGSQTFNSGGLGGGFGGSAANAGGKFKLKQFSDSMKMRNKFSAQSFNAGGGGGGLGASSANAGGNCKAFKLPKPKLINLNNFKAQTFNAGGPGGFGASGSSANAASQSFNGKISHQ